MQALNHGAAPSNDDGEDWTALAFLVAAILLIVVLLI